MSNKSNHARPSRIDGSKHANGQDKPSKISAEFLKQLERLTPDNSVQAIVVLHSTSNKPHSGTTKRPSREERHRTIEAIRETSAKALVEVDRILSKFHGKRLAERADALGTIPVEVSVLGVIALAQSPVVRTVLENQPISLLGR